MTDKTIIKYLIAILALVIVFHILIIAKMISFDIAWGGRLGSEQEMYVFEGISIASNLLLIWTLSLKAKGSNSKFVNITLWIFFVIFVLNTIGNLFAHTPTEKFFAIVTLVFAALLWKILKKKKPSTTS